MKILNKSQVNCFLNCPYKWKRIYIDGIKSKPSQAQARGIRIHNKIEKFYKNPIADEELKEFIGFELERLKQIKKPDKLKYFKPLFQELKMQNEEIGLKGTCDAVYLNPEDDELIVLDYKSGRFYPNKYDDYRFELAVYSELLKHSGKVDKEPKYWAILFVDQKKLFFEKIDKKYINNMYEIIDECRKEMEGDDFKPKKNNWCFSCQFKRECGV